MEKKRGREREDKKGKRGGEEKRRTDEKRRGAEIWREREIGVG